jgi:hypothetical protein
MDPIRSSLFDMARMTWRIYVSKTIADRVWGGLDSDEFFIIL